MEQGGFNLTDSSRASLNCFFFFYSVGYKVDPVELQMMASSFSVYEVDKRRCLLDNGKLKCKYVGRRKGRERVV